MEKTKVRPYTPHNVSKRTYLSPPGEINSGKRMVDTTGFIPTKMLIQQLLEAGDRLVASRAEMYDYNPGQKDDGEFIDPTRDKRNDITDIEEAGRKAEDSNNALKSKTAKKRADESRKAEEARQAKEAVVRELTSSEDIPD